MTGSAVEEPGAIVVGWNPKSVGSNTTHQTFSVKPNAWGLVGGFGLGRLDEILPPEGSGSPDLFPRPVWFGSDKRPRILSHSQWDAFAVREFDLSIPFSFFALPGNKQDSDSHSRGSSAVSGIPRLAGSRILYPIPPGGIPTSYSSCLAPILFFHL